MTQLNSQQWDELIEQYVELITDSMDWKTMHHFVVNTLTEDYDNLSEEELFTEIECSFDKETLEELMDNVKNPADPDVTTYSLEVGESITFPSSS